MVITEQKWGVEMFGKSALWGVLVLVFCFAFQGVTSAQDEQENFFLNPGFEEGTTSWHMDTGGNTVADFAVDKKDAIEGRNSALVTINTIDSWGSQFGQTFDAGEKDKTYTFAVLVKSEGGPVTVTLQIERPADPWDRALRSDALTFNEDKWTELHATFKVSDDFPEGWFAYISCGQAKAEYRADLFRLYEGEYIPYEELELEKSVSASTNSLITTWGDIKKS